MEFKKGRDNRYLKAVETLYRLQQCKIKVSLSNGNRLQLEIPEDSDYSKLLENVKSYKVEIIDLISKAGNKIPFNKHIYSVPNLNIYPLSFMQESLWFMSQYQGDYGYVYNETIRLDFDKKITHLPHLEQAVNSLIKKQASFRTIFEKDKNGVPYQKVLPFTDDSGVKLEAEVLCINDLDSNILQIEHHVFDLSKSAHKFYLFDVEENGIYVLIAVMHHIITDGVTMCLIKGELTNNYNQIKNNQKLELQPPLLRYGDFTIWQRTYFQGEILEGCLKYWKNKLKDFEYLQLPTDKVRPAVYTYHGSRFRFEIGSKLKQGLNGLAKKHKCSLFMIMLTGLYILYYRYSRQKDIIIGTPISGRYCHSLQLKKMMGCFINSLALRVIINGQTVEEFLELVKHTCLEAFQNKDLQFDLLVKSLNVARDLSHTSIFQTVFVLQSFNEDAVSQLTSRSSDCFYSEAHSDQAANFDILVSVEDYNNLMCVRVDANADLFEANTVKRMFKNYMVILEAMVNDQSVTVDRISMLTQEEYTKVVFKWNTTSRDYPLDLGICELFETQVEKTPNNVAVEFKIRQFTYAELNERANQLARYLVDKGINIQQKIALLLDRDEQYLISILAVWKSQNIFTPLNPDDVLQKNERIIKELSDPIILTTKNYISLAESIKPERTDILLADFHGIERYEKSNLCLKFNSQHLAYIMFTSGSTGIPKGASLFHKGMLNHLCSKITDFNIDENDIVAQTATQTFDVSIWQFMVALLVGGKVHIFDKIAAWEPVALIHEILNAQITIYESVPSHMSLILEELEADPSQYNLSSLRWFIMNGEGLPPAYCKRWFNIYPHIPMANVYGPTECSDDVTHYKFSDVGRNFGGYMPIGKAISNTQLYVLDQHMQPAPIGVPGELYISGACVGGGYINQAEKTKEYFVESSLSNSLLYKTGDIVRFLADGNLEYINRVDSQVKINGIRIEIAEIESRINEFAGIKKAAVIFHEDRDSQSKYLICYYTCSNNVSFDANHLKNLLSKKLPMYMVPTLLKSLKEIPVTVNGKTDYKALPIPDITSLQSQDTYVPPRSDLEVKLLSIWQEIFKDKKIGINDNFFTLGGHSLLAIRLITKINLAFKKNYPVIILFYYQTVKKFCEFMEEGEAKKSVNEDIEQAIQDAKLSISKVNVRQYTEVNQVKEILLTGATGFLGVYLLEELLSATKARIYCLVRKHRGMSIYDKFQKALAYYGKGHLYDSERIVLLEGDLTSQNLGLTSETIEYIKNNIDHIYHNGAYVHHMFDYRSLRSANVLSTYVLLQIAAAGKKTCFHYVSNISVGLGKDKDSNVIEHEFSDVPHSHSGYDMSKWASEKIIKNAADKGLSVSIFRPGYISGDSTRGVCNPHKNRALLLLKGCIQMRAAPLWHETLEMTPVDVVSKSIVKLSLRENMSDVMTFNLDNPTEVAWVKYIQVFQSMGYDISLVEPQRWIDEHLKCIDEANTLYSIREFYMKTPSKKAEKQSIEGRPNMTHIQEILKAEHIEYPKNYDKYLEKCATYLQEIAFLID